MNVTETFTYISANRRGDKPLIEQLFTFSASECEALQVASIALAEKLASSLERAGIIATSSEIAVNDQHGDPLELFFSLYTNTALVLQQAAGHRVEGSLRILENDRHQCRTAFEYEEEETGTRAGQLALLYVATLCPALDWTSDALDEAKPLAELTTEFRKFASQRVLPADTQAIINAAVRADIPYLKFDRSPFERRTADFRIRANSPLNLGHSRHSHIVDGTFCIDRCTQYLELLSDREQLSQLMRSCDLPLPGTDFESGDCSTLSRAKRKARRIGYPVVLKPSSKRGGSGVTTDIPDETALSRAFEKASAISANVRIERQVAGSTFKLIVANRQLVAIVVTSSAAIETQDVTSKAHPSVVEHALRLATAVDVGVLVLSFVSSDISRPHTETGAAFVDLDLAPELDAFLPWDSPLLARTATNFIRWLFPSGCPSRIPLIAVTGTNGKTTTCRMTRFLLEQADYTPGLACSDGAFGAGEKKINTGDLSGITGAYPLLADPEIDAAVLETARGGLLKHGFAFDRCDIAVCLNVTADHLGECGIDTPEQMAAVKRSVLQRCRDAAVLNADDPLCLGMLPLPNAKRICLVSTERSIQDLRGLPSAGDCFALLEKENGIDHVVLYDGYRRLRIARVQDIPSTFGGLARYNISNALHACAACYLAEVSVEALEKGLTRFKMNYESTPGRLNFRTDLPFKVLLDYAHNPDGITRVCSFIDQLPANGRKIVALSAAGYNPVEIIRGNAAAVVGHFDHYICYNFLGNIKMQWLHVPETIKQALLDYGVPESDVSLTETGLDAIETMLNHAQQGDLLVILSGHRDRPDIWERINSVA